MPKKRKPAKRNHVAKITIWRAGEMTAKGRRTVARWLPLQANDLESMGAEYAPRYTGRYMAR